MLENFLFNLWYKEKHRFVLILLFPLQLIYCFIITVRNLYYDIFKKSKTLDTKVISIGNINLGGTGKTPFLIYLLDILSKKHKKILLLSRGYGSKKSGELFDIDGFSDEGRLIKNRFSDIVIWTGRDRIKSYNDYKEKYGIPEVVILDDGFQHRKINRDEDIVIINGHLLFGNGLLFPAGPLREPLSSITKRADVIVLKDGDDHSYGELRNLFKTKEIMRFELKETYFVDFFGNRVDKSLLKDKEIIAFCGIANPYGFFDDLERELIKVNKQLIFPDHYNYNKDAIEKICKKREAYYITTEKDFVKIRSIWRDKDRLFIFVKDYHLWSKNKDDLKG